MVLAYALEGRWTAIECPSIFDERNTDPDELLSLAEQVGDKERAYVAHDFRLHSHWALADRAGVDVEMDALCRVADELRQPAHRWHLTSTQAVLAIMEGRFDHAEELISVALVLGRASQSWNAGVSQTLQLFALRREQGRLAEVEDSIRRGVHEYPALVRFRCAAAHLASELGREADARAALDSVLSHDLRAGVPRRGMAPRHVDACRRLRISRDGSAAEQLYELLLPYDGKYAEAPMEAAFGSVARALGVLARTLARLDDAERHFDDALDTELAMHARPWVAHAQHDYAATLLARDGPGDGQGLASSSRRRSTPIDASGCRAGRPEPRRFGLSSAALSRIHALLSPFPPDASAAQAPLLRRQLTRRRHPPGGLTGQPGGRRARGRPDP